MGPIASLKDLISALRRRAGLIVLVILIGVPLAIWYVLLQPRQYEATAVIQIEVPRVDESLTGPQGGAANSQLELIQQQLLSRDNMTALIEQFDLFEPALSMTQKVVLLRESVMLVKLIDPTQAWRPDVQPSGLSINVRLGDPKQAADVANAMLETIITEAQARAEERASGTLDFLSVEEARIAAEVAEIENRIADFRETNVDSLPEGLTAQRERLADLGESQLVIDREILTLESASGRIRPEVVTRRIELLGQQRALIDGNITQIEAAIAATPAVERELGAMTRELTQLEAELSVITGRRTEAAMNMLLESRDQAARFVVLETALEPEFPISTSRTRLAIAGVVGVALVAFGLALAIELANPTIRSAAQMERQLGIQPVIVVPYLRKVQRRRGNRTGILTAFAMLMVAGWLAFRNGLLDRFLTFLPRSRLAD